MPQRDAQSNKLIVPLGDITIAAGDATTVASVDAKGARAVTFFIEASTPITTLVAYAEIWESSDDGVADAFAPVSPKEKQLPTVLNVEYEAGQFGQLVVTPTAPYLQSIGVFSSERYVKVNIHTDTTQVMDFAVYAILEMETGEQTATWNPTVSSVDGKP